MTPDDARHGSPAGYVEHTKTGVAACLPCRRAKAAYERQRFYDTHLGRPRIVPTLGVQRRIRALQCLGWSLRMIAEECGWNNPEDLHYALTNPTCNRKTRERVVAAYERLSMQIPPHNSGTARARNRAKRLGYAPPLSWDDIDRDEAPVVAPRSGSYQEEVDEAMVLRVLNGGTRPRHLTAAEATEVVRRLLTRGLNGPQIQALTGLKIERYHRARDVA